MSTGVGRTQSELKVLADHIPVAYHILCHVDSIGVDLFNAFLWPHLHASY